MAQPNKMLEAALAYQRKGLSVIPCRQDKKPLIPWEPHQTRRAEAQEIKSWFSKWPDMNIGIVTGEISGMDVVDVDTPEGYELLAGALGDDVATFNPPIASTPRDGKHLYVVNTGEGNKTSFLKGVDYRGQGGFAVAPPSIGANGKPYQWIEGRSLFELAAPACPQAVLSLIKNLSLSLYRGCKENVRSAENSLQFLTQGTRDNDLFHVANCLIKGGCKEETAREVLNILSNQCNPPFPEKEAQAKIDSVLSRCERRERNLTEDLRRWIDLTSAYFSLTEAYDPLQILTSQKNTVHQIMHRFVKDGYVERHPNKNGIYRRIDRDIEFMNFADADIENTVKVSLPLDLHKKTNLYPKGVIVGAGVSGTGKTLFAFNSIADNMHRFPTFYFNSEMGPEALKKKLSHFPIPITEWSKHMKVVDQWDFNNICDKIQPDAFNVIDYLEPEGDKPFNIHGVISAIIRRLNKGTALIMIQKKPGATMGTGGIYSIKASTLAVSLEWGKLEVVKNRFREADSSPLLNKINFEVHEGYRFVKQGGWYS